MEGSAVWQWHLAVTVVSLEAKTVLIHPLALFWVGSSIWRERGATREPATSLSAGHCQHPKQSPFVRAGPIPAAWEASKSLPKLDPAGLSL